MDIKAIQTQNPHWATDQWPKTPPRRRHLLAKLWQHCQQTKLMIYLIGARRTGKSVLLKQLAEDLLGKGVTTPKQILWWEFPANSSVGDIEEIFNYYYQEIVNKEQVSYIFFDEIQYVNNFEATLKQLYDLHEGKIKFFLTGSLSLLYKRRVQESMLGRFLPYRLFPLSFIEYLDILDDQTKLDQYERVKNETNPAIKKYIANTLVGAFREFLLGGRFPETVGKPTDWVKLYLESTSNLALGQDAFTYFRVHRPGELKNLYEYFRINSGGEMSISRLAKNVSFETVSNYLDILEMIGLVYFVYNSTDPIIKKNVSRKGYVNSAFYLESTKFDVTTALGFAAESYVLERLLESGQEVTFWRQRNKEIDFLVPKAKKAYEVKFRSQLDEPKLLKSFAGKHNYSPTVITLDTWENKNGIEYLPACLL